MSARVIVFGRALDTSSRQEILALPGWSVRELATRHRHPDWGDQQLAAMVDGRIVDDWTIVPPDGAIVSIGPRIGSAVTLALAVVSAASTLYQYDKAKKQQRAARRWQQRREERTYSWDTPNLTAYGEGAVLADVWGYHRVGGAVMGSRVEQSRIVRFGTELSLLIGLSNGPVAEIGGISAGTYGEADLMTRNRGTTPQWPYDTHRFPSGLRINGIDADPDSTVVSLRYGRDIQSVMPDWPGAYETTAVGSGQLTVINQAALYQIADTEIEGLSAELYFPLGLYDGTKQAVGPRGISCTVEMAWRRQGSATWSAREGYINAERQPDGSFVFGPPILNPFSASLDFGIPPGTQGPFDLRITRTLNNHEAQRPSAFTWQSLTRRVGTGFSYPGVAYMGVRLQATEQGSSSVNQVSIPVKGRTVRAWISDVDGWVEGWDAVLPWTFPIGRNPAHVFVTKLLDPDGLGRFVTDDDIDLPAMRDWADLCDELHPLDNSQALLRYDAVDDQPTSAIESLIQVAAAGRAIPLIVGGKISVKLHYRDGYAKGSGSTLNTVPARAPVAVFTTSGMTDFSVTYTDPRTQPNVLDYQILDEAADWDHRLISVEDPLAIVDDGDPAAPRLRRETVNAFGVTRRIQAVYEAHLALNVNRLSRRTVTFTAPLDAVPLEVGDIITVQHDALMPGGSETYSARVTEAVAAGSSVKLSQPVTVTGTPPSGTGIWLREDDGTYRELQINEAAGTYAAGTALDLWDPVGAAPAVVDLLVGTQVLVGAYTTAEVLYEVVSITTDPDLRRRIEADEWSADMFDVDAGVDYGDGVPAGGGLPVPTPVELTGAQSPEVTPPLWLPGVRRTEQVVRWSPPSRQDGDATGRRSRVYARVPGAVEWTLLGETDAHEIRGVSLPIGETYDLAITLADADGRYPAPGAVTAARVVVPEFAGGQPPAAGGLTALAVHDGVQLRWRKLAEDGQVAYYEVRRGPQWYGAEVLARVPGDVYLHQAPAVATVTYWVAPRTTGGLYASAPASVSVAWSLPDEIASATDLVSSAAGTVGAGLSWTGSAIEMDSDVYSGTYTAVQLDADIDQALYWSVAVDLTATDTADLSELPAITIPSAEALWRRPEGREPSPLQPGADFDVDVATLTEPAESYDYRYPPTTVGRYFQALVETRFYAAAAWSAWAPHANGFRVAESMQARVVLRRFDVRYRLQLSSLRLWCGW